MVAGLEHPSAGVIRIGDRIVNQLPPRERRVAMVFQTFALYPHMDVFKNLAFGLKMRGARRSDIQRRVIDAARMLGLESLLERKPAQLSGGQQQRVALGRAVVSGADVFLFDEPLSNLDAQLRIVMRTELVKLQRRLKTTTVHVTHDQAEAMTMGTRIAVMSQGRLQQVGEPMELYERPANRFVATFIGSPPMNVVPGVLRGGGRDVYLELDRFRLPLPHAVRERGWRWIDRPVEWGIRPEHVSLSAPRNGPAETLSGEVLIARPLGSETLYDLKCGNLELIARDHAPPLREAGSAVEIIVDPGHCHLFAPESGDRI
jgi:multiple sugar transport system ATP-binding protein